jgi:galactofuranose transport system permease protein
MSSAGLARTVGSLRTWRTQLVRSVPTYGALAALALLIVANAIGTRNFATWGNLWNILIQVSSPVLVAVGMTLVMAGGGIDLSVGSIMAIASVAAVASIGWGAGAAVLAGLATAAAVGFLNGALVARFHIQPFVVTLAVLIAGRSAAQVLSREGQLIPFDNPAFEFLGQGYVGPIPVQVLIAALVVVLAQLVLSATTFGRYLLAVGGNEAAAVVAGVPVAPVRLATYLATGVLAGLAGLIDTARLGTTDPANIGSGMEFTAIAAVVIGGTPFSGGRANLLGTVAGALMLQVIGASLNMHLVPFAWSLVANALIILLAVYLQRPRSV